MSTTSESSSSLIVLRRVRSLQRVIPIGLMLLVVIYEIGPARWILEGVGEDYHLATEILIYGLIGPVLAYLFLHFLERWLEERETSELQARLLAHTREQARVSRELSDQALQTLFAASVLLATLKSSLTDLPLDKTAALQQTEQALDRAIQQIRIHLENQSPPQVMLGKE